MAKPDRGLIRKNMTMHPSIKDEVVDFAKARSLEVVLNGDVKNFAVITKKSIEVTVYKAQYDAPSENRNYIKVSSLKDLEGIQFHDYAKLSNKYDIPEVDKIVEAVLKNINSVK
jgi:hypothetical protein